MKAYTVDDMMLIRPCPAYPEDRIRDLWAGRTTLTEREIAALLIPVEDRFWAVISACLDDRQRRLLVCDYASDALGRISDPDQRSVTAVEVARRYARGEATAEELSAACGAAWTATKAATKDVVAWSATKAAAWAAARDVARDIICNIAWAAAKATAEAPTWGVVRGEAMERYLSWAVEYAEGIRA